MPSCLGLSIVSSCLVLSCRVSSCLSFCLVLRINTRTQLPSNRPVSERIAVLGVGMLIGVMVRVIRVRLKGKGKGKGKG